ncbi:MAG: hypothetical protein SFW07_03695 [Gammaproteobacteria bacterium]|nr:hypothetical protein [Gammaproteobacteria bacterium]
MKYVLYGVRCVMYSLLTLIALLGLSRMSFAKTSIQYCTHNNEKPANTVENTLLQQLVPRFAKSMGCQIGNNCLGKWNNQENPSKYSIAWEKQCGPVIGGVAQLGDNGAGSTFTCQKNPDTGKVCCSPLGYEYVNDFMVCEK